MKNSEKAEIAVVGGTGFEGLFENGRKLFLGTPYGIPPSIHAGSVDNRDVFFLPRHGPRHSVPPHKINYRANIYALHQLGVKRIIATNAVGAINPDFGPEDFVVPHDFVDFTKIRRTTFCEGPPVTHVDVSQPYCPEIRKLLIETSEKLEVNVRGKAVLACTEGPRYETPAEIRMFGQLGCDVVGMTGIPEAVLAKELEICYASICYISNMASGMQGRLTAHEISKVSRKIAPEMEQILIETIRILPSDRDCPCANALAEARLE